MFNNCGWGWKGELCFTERADFWRVKTPTLARLKLRTSDDWLMVQLGDEQAQLPRVRGSRLQHTATRSVAEVGAAEGLGT